MNRARALVAGLDPQSRVVLRRFAFLVAFFTFWSAAFGVKDLLSVFAVMTFVAAMAEIAMALFRREKISATSLGNWDLAAALFGLHCLARGLA